MTSPIPSPRSRLSALLRGRLRLPVIGAPMFIVSGPDLVVAQCRAGIVGALPALNARPAAALDAWLTRIAAALAAHDAAHPDRPSAPYAVNLIVHRSNARLEEDLATCARHRVPLVITSLGARPDVNAAVRDWGGVVLHDVTNQAFARKAIEKGADGLILVAAGAGGHAGTTSPFALTAETRAWFDGPLVLAGAIATGRGIRAAEILGADLVSIGSPFIATREAEATPDYKAAIAAGQADDIVHSAAVTGVAGNYLRASLERAGLDPAASAAGGLGALAGGAKAWRDIWGAGQGIGSVGEVVAAQALVARLSGEYDAAGTAPRPLFLRP